MDIQKTVYRNLMIMTFTLFIGMFTQTITNLHLTYLMLTIVLAPLTALFWFLWKTRQIPVETPEVIEEFNNDVMSIEEANKLITIVPTSPKKVVEKQKSDNDGWIKGWREIMNG